MSRNTIFLLVAVGVAAAIIPCHAALQGSMTRPDMAATYEDSLRSLRSYHHYIHQSAHAVRRGRALALTSECQQLVDWGEAALQAEAASCNVLFNLGDPNKHGGGSCDPDADDDDNAGPAATPAHAAVACTEPCYDVLMASLKNLTDANCAGIPQKPVDIGRWRPEDDVYGCTVDADCYDDDHTCQSDGFCATSCTDNNPCLCSEECSSTLNYCVHVPSLSQPNNINIRGIYETWRAICISKPGSSPTEYCFATVFEALQAFTPTPSGCDPLLATGCCWGSTYNYLVHCAGEKRLDFFVAFCGAIPDQCPESPDYSTFSCFNGAASFGLSKALAVLTAAAAVLLSVWRF